MSKILYQTQLNYLTKFRKEIDMQILEMEDFAEQKNVPILDWSSAEFLEQLIWISNPKRVLEIGTAIGYSSIRIAKNLGKKGVLYTIEKSADNILIAKDNINNSGLEDKIVLIEGEALTEMPKMKKKFDFIFLDADKQDYLRLFDYSILLLKKGGIIFIDNLLWNGYAASSEVPENYKRSTELIREFNEKFMSQKNIKSTILPIGDGIGLGIKTK
ncbi:MAG: O-methyltransferase [Ignavibacteriales bacterium]|nr:MAG: O-methyltransferase [Ignavibacteriales bacterium]